MDYTAFLDSLGFSFPDWGEAVWQDACAEYEARGCVYVTDAFLDELALDLDCFPQNRDFICRSAAAIRENEPLGRFTVFLAHALRRDMRALMHGDWTLPAAPSDADPAPYGMTGFFAEMALVPETAQALRRRGVPESVVRDTMACFDWSVLIFAGQHEHPGYNAGRVRWTIHFLIPDILRIGRLEYQLFRFSSPMRVFLNEARELRILADGCRLHHSGQILGSAGCMDEGWPGTPWAAFPADFRETEDCYEGCPVEGGVVSRLRVRLPKSEWKPFLQPGDPALTGHIPARLPFGHDTVLDSYTHARMVFGLCYEDFPFRAIVCTSWLMDPVLAELLGPDANISRFQSDYLFYPHQASGRGVYSFLYNMPDARPEELPARSTLQRLVRERLLSGGYILEQSGILMPQALA